jgi:uncharacterized phage protein gp47/JayE
MLYTRPSYTNLRARIAADLAALPAALSGPLSAAWAKACAGLHGHLDWSVLQTSPLTCELERLYDYAALYQVERLDATGATGYLTATGTPGAQLLGDALARATNGLDYQVVAAVTMPAGGSVQVAVRCTSTGAASNLVTGQTLTLTSGVAGIDNTLTASAPGVTGGADLELLDDWRARVVDEWQTVVTVGARGGRSADYVYWSKGAHPSVTGALVQLHVGGIGIVTVRPICNGLSDRLPSQAVLDAVAARLTDIAPVCDIRAIAPTLRPVAVQLHLAVGADTAGTRTAITTALTNLVNAEQTGGSLLTLAEIDVAVGSVTTQFARLAPVADTTCQAGEILKLQVTWA